LYIKLSIWVSVFLKTLKIYSLSIVHSRLIARTKFKTKNKSNAASVNEPMI